jgi:hypothetical protein
MKRPGYNTKGRPPDSVIESRIEQAIEILSAEPTVRRCKLHRKFCPAWKVHWATVDRIVHHARAEMMKRLGRSKEDFRAESLAFYEILTKDKKASVGERVRARQRIDELLGLDAPKKQDVAVSGPAGGKIELEVKSKATFDYVGYQKLAESFFESLTGNGSGESVHTPHTNGETGDLPGANRP